MTIAHLRHATHIAGFIFAGHSDHIVNDWQVVGSHTDITMSLGILQLTKVSGCGCGCGCGCSVFLCKNWQPCAQKE